MASRKKRRGRRIARRRAAVWNRCRQWCAGVRRAAGVRLHPWAPAVEVDVDGKRGRRLRTAIARVTRSHLHALGVTPPEHLLVVVQRTVAQEGRPLAALLQVFEGSGGRKRHVLFLALTAGDRKVGDEEVVATLRQQLQRIVAAELGTLLDTAAEPARVEREIEVAPPAPERPESPLDELAATPDAFRGLHGTRPIAAHR